jgi:hypothetical protein
MIRSVIADTDNLIGIVPPNILVTTSPTFKFSNSVIAITHTKRCSDSLSMVDRLQPEQVRDPARRFGRCMWRWMLRESACPSPGSDALASTGRRSPGRQRHMRNAQCNSGTSRTDWAARCDTFRPAASHAQHGLRAEVVDRALLLNEPHCMAGEMLGPVSVLTSLIALRHAVVLSWAIVRTMAWPPLGLDQVQSAEKRHNSWQKTLKAGESPRFRTKGTIGKLTAR